VLLTCSIIIGNVWRKYGLINLPKKLEQCRAIKTKVGCLYNYQTVIGYGKTDYRRYPCMSYSAAHPIRFSLLV
jgi:hypothetical protein